jgi:hypothetical protein
MSLLWMGRHVARMKSVDMSTHSKTLARFRALSPVISKTPQEIQQQTLLRRG